MTSPNPKLSTSSDKAAAFVGEKFTSSLAAFKMHTEAGGLIAFCANQFITANEEEIDFLKAAIKAKVPGIAYAGEATSDDLDPMAGLKRRMANEVRDEIRAELLAEQEATRDLGSTEAKSVIPASTAIFAAASGSSNSK
jgi:hypothetical protein